MKKKLEKRLKNLSSKNSMAREHISPSASLVLSSELEKNKKRIEEEIKKLVIECDKKYEKLLKYAKEKGTEFYLIKNSDKLLNFINEKQGLIFSKKGLSALYLNLLTSRRLSFRTRPIFVFEKGAISPYQLLYSFYKWYANKENLPGFDDKTLLKFKNIFDKEADLNLDDFSYNDIVSLKQAISRDREAMEFVLNFVKEKESAKNAFDVMKNGDKGTNI